MPDFNLMHFTPYRLSVAAQKISEELARLYRDSYDITNPQWRVLAHLAHSGEVSVREIEARVAMEKSKVSRAASRLEAAGYIAKSINDSDRRLVKLSLTPKGKALMVELLALAQSYQQEIEKRLGATFAGLELGLEKILGDET
ncbi:winged helix-turn-helix transcriptional regulator [Rhizobium pusense]|nr:winged helix-turn-helix transcriptional regulator [Agrobacterium pusense]